MATSYTTRLGNAPEEGIKAPCVVATTANITLSGEQTIGGLAVVSGDRVLVRAQTDATENGIYDAVIGAWKRSKDFNSANDVVNGVLVVDTNSGEVYQAVFAGSWTPGVTSITFVSQAFSTKVSRTGDTMTGQLKGITPVSPEDLTRKDYVDDQIAASATGSDIIIHRDYIADMTADLQAGAGKSYIVGDYASGRNAGPLYFNCLAGTGTDDGGSVINHDTLNLRFEQDFGSGEIDVRKFGVYSSVSSDTVAAANNDIQLKALCVYAIANGYSIRSTAEPVVFEQIILDNDDLVTDGNLIIRGEGRGSVWVRLDNVLVTNFDMLFTVSANSILFGNILVENMAFDGNAANQATPVPYTQFEQSATFKVQAITGGYIKSAIFNNCYGVDPAADDFLVGPSNTVNTIGLVVFNTMQFEARERSRSSILTGSACAQVIINNVRGDNSGTFESRIESEFSTSAGQEISVAIDNVDIGKIEMGGTPESVIGGTYNVRISNAKTRVHTIITRGIYLVRDSDLLIDYVSNNWIDTSGQVNNCTLRLGVDETTKDGIDLYLQKGDNVGNTFKFNHVVFKSNAPETEITNVVDNGSGLYRVTAVGHGLSTGAYGTVTGVNGCPGVDDTWQVTVIDVDTLDLDGSTFTGAYSSRGTIAGISGGARCVRLGLSTDMIQKTEFFKCEFDPKYDSSIYNDRGGELRTTECKIGGTDEGVYLNDSSATNYRLAKYISTNDDFTPMKGAFPVDFASSVSGGKSLLEMHGGRYNTTNIDLASSVITNTPIVSTRFFQVTTKPTGGGLAGDTAQLDDASYAAAASTDEVAWKCMEHGVTSATWIATLTKP